ncbi:MAG: ABC transporter ATP-binding protein [Caldisphaeraceae archaeon]|nr:ABC transporter ATP-binding protein [Caldisphaeraceae archaeon]
MDYAIQVKDLNKSYGSNQALVNISLSVRRGELVSLLGPNGAGKTTLVKHLYCELKPEVGRINVLGGNPCRSKIKRMLGVVPQESEPYDDLSVFENIYYAARIRGIGRREAKVYTEETIESLDLREYRNKYVMDLSGGLKRRTLVGMAIVHRPEVLILDEPTTGLDPLARRQLWDILKNLKKEGRAILLTTHYVEEAEVLSDRVYFINKKIISEGTPSDLRTRFSYYYEVIDYTSGKAYKVKEEELKEFISKLNGKFEVRIPSLEDVYIEMISHA